MATDSSSADLLAAQYQLVKKARAALLAYCAGLAPTHFVARTLRVRDYIAA